MTAQVRKPRGGANWPQTVACGSASVKVYEVEHSTNASGKAYVLAWHSPEGRKTQKFADPAKALEEGKIKASQLANGQIEAADMKRSDRDELQQAKAIAGDVPVLAALREWKRIRELTAGHAIAAAELWAQRNAKAFKRVKVADAVDQFIAAKERAKKQGERTYRSKLDPLKTYFPETFIDSITAEQFSAYLEQWQDGVTRNDFRKRTVSLCRWAQKSGFIPHGLQLEIENTERAEEEPTEIGTITPGTFRKALQFIQAKHPQHLAALVVAGFAAMRSDEIQGKHHDRTKRQTWEDIDLTQKHLNVTVAKRNTPAWRLVELCDAAISWLKVCPGEHKGPICEENAIAKIRALLIEAKFELPENCFRHSAISYRIAATGDKAATATWAGNSVREIDKRYRRPMTKAAGLDWFSIGPGV